MLPLLLLPLLWAGSLQQDPRFKLQLQDSPVTVQTGLCVLVSCSFSYPWSRWNSPNQVYISWFRDGEEETYYPGPVATNHPTRHIKKETRGRFPLLGDVRTKNCSLSIRDARWEDAGSYVLRADIGLKTSHLYKDKKLTLQVTALKEKPIIHLLEPLMSSRPTSLSCHLPGSCEGGGPLLFSWMGAVTDSMDPQALQSPVISLTPRPQDHNTSLTCQVKLHGTEVTTERTVQLNVSYAPQNLSVHIFFRNSTALKVPSSATSLPVLEGQSLQLVCMADSNLPASLSWFWKTWALSPSQVSASGVLELPCVGVEDEGEFTCQVQHQMGSQNLSLSLSVQRGSSSCLCVPEKQEGSWPLVLTLLRGALMGAGFLLTYGLTWTYYTRCAGAQGSRAKRPG